MILRKPSLFPSFSNEETKRQRQIYLQNSHILRSLAAGHEYRKYKSAMKKKKEELAAAPVLKNAADNCSWIALRRHRICPAPLQTLWRINSIVGCRARLDMSSIYSSAKVVQENWMAENFVTAISHTMRYSIHLQKHTIDNYGWCMSFLL